MLTILLTTWLSAAGSWEEGVFSAVDTIELSLTPKAQQYRVGEVFVLGSDSTPNSVILDQIPLYTAGRLCFWRMRLAEFRLACTGLFEVDLKRQVWPRVTPLDSAEGSKFRAIKVEVREKKARSP